jgi:haloalkane dehalogenase
MKLKKKYFISIVISSFIFFSCGSNNSMKDTTLLTYSKFRKSQKSFLSTDGIIKYIDKGEGKVILLLHGIPTSSWLYRKMIDGLVSQGYRVIAPDMLGFGNSDTPDGYEIYSAKQHGKRILELMNDLDINKWSHVTHDAGGLWTWALFKQDNQRIEKLILLNTIVFEEGFHPPIKMKKGIIAKFSMWLYKNGVTTNLLLKGLFKSGLMENNLTKIEIEGYKKPLLEGKTKGMYYFFSKTCNTFPDTESIIKNLEIPVAVIWGKHDKMLQIAPQKKKMMDAMKIQEKDIHIIDAKHFIQEEKPTEINSLILNFIKK